LAQEEKEIEIDESDIKESSELENEVE